MTQLLVIDFSGKAYLKINLLVKTPLHRCSMEVRRSGLWAPAIYHSSSMSLTIVFGKCS